MRVVCLLILSVMAHCLLFVVSVDLPADISSMFADKVSVFDAKLPADRFDDFRQFKLRIRIEATVSNSICLRLGRDGLYGAPNGKLAIEETLLEIGIERNGEMYLLKNRMKDRFVHTLSNPGISQERTLTFKVRVAPDNPSEVRSIISEDNGTPFTFEELKLNPLPAELNPVLWTDLRLLVRNGGVQSVDVKFLKDGSLIVIR